jgi:pimeloyl-ACP methyl ester carboxylesterase
VAFAGRSRFVAYSRRFQGPGPWGTDGDNSAEAHVADLLAIIRGLDAGSVHLVGFSTAIALRAALERPDLIGTLTIVEPNVPWLLQSDGEGEAVLDWWRRENDRVRAEAGGDAARYAELWFELVNNQGPGRFAVQTAAFREMWIENMTAARPPASDSSPLTCDRLRAIALPTLAIAGQDGMPYSRLIVERLASCLPDCQFVVIPAVTHFMSHQAPSTFNETVLAFLDRHRIGSSARSENKACASWFGSGLHWPGSHPSAQRARRPPPRSRSQPAEQRRPRIERATAQPQATSKTLGFYALRPIARWVRASARP